MKTFPVLWTERLVLGEIRLAHAEDIRTLFSDPEIVRFRGGGLEDLTETRDFIGRLSDSFDAGAGICWELTLRGKSQLIGTCSLSWSPANDSAHLGYDLAPPWWGKGLMREAVQGVLTYAFDTVGLNRVQATTRVDNCRSTALLQSLQFQQEGVLRDFAVMNGRAYDMRCFSRLRREWLRDAVP